MTAATLEAAVERLTELCEPDPFHPAKEFGAGYDARQLKRLRAFIKLTPEVLSALSTHAARIVHLEERDAVLQQAVHDVCAERDAARARMAELEGALNWLAARSNYELSHGYDDPEDEGSWRVHRMNGGINDREWTLIATGSSPLYAIQSAMEKEAKPVTMLVDQGWLAKHVATDPECDVEASPASPAAVAEQTEGEG